MAAGDTSRLSVEVGTEPQAAAPAASGPGGITGETVAVRVFKGVPGSDGAYVTYDVPEVAGMVVLDAVHHIQRNLDTDLACRWNCKSAKCGSCSAEVNGRPALLCKTRVDRLPRGTITIAPLKAFPLIKDLVTDVSRNYEINKLIPPFTAAPDDGKPWRIQQMDRVLPLPGHLPCHPHARSGRPLLRPTLLRPRRQSGDAPQGRARPP
jgi:hypothetical protein